MSKGRPPKSTSDHLRDGTYRNSRHSDEKQRTKGVPRKPVWLSPQAEVLWDQEFATLCDQWVLYESDSYTMGQFFEACAVAVMARQSMYPDNPKEESIGLHGAVIGKPNNFTGELELKKHPGITAWKDAVSVMQKIVQEIERRGARDHPEKPDDDTPPVFTAIPGGKK